MVCSRRNGRGRGRGRGGREGGEGERGMRKPPAWRGQHNRHLEDDQPYIAIYITAATIEHRQSILGHDPANTQSATQFL